MRYILIFISLVVYVNACFVLSHIEAFLEVSWGPKWVPTIWLRTKALKDQTTTITYCCFHDISFGCETGPYEVLWRSITVCWFKALFFLIHLSSYFVLFLYSWLFSHSIWAILFPPLRKFFSSASTPDVSSLYNQPPKRIILMIP